VLGRLFLDFGMPLVLKCDNGPPFRADLTKIFLDALGVFILFSPPYWPRYNGAIEAAIGSLKSRTARLAAWLGRPLHWLAADPEAARRQANTRAPKVHGPTPAETWALRHAVTDSERARFAIAVQRRQYDVCIEQGLDPNAERDHWDQSAIDRE